MSVQSLLGYDDLSSLRSAPSYTAEPLENEQRIALNDRLRPHPRGSFVKHSKHGHARLKLIAQEDGITTPVYGFSGLIRGTVEMDPEKAENVDSVEVKVEGALKLNEAAEAGSAVIKLVIDTQSLWTKGPTSGQECPNNLDFSMTLPTTFTYQGLTYPLPPTYSVKLKGLPGFTASIDYSVSALINRPNTVPTMVPLVKSKTLGIHIGTTIISTPFLYHPRTRPPTPLPRLSGVFSVGYDLSSDWQTFEVVSLARKSRVQDVVVKLRIPKSRIFSLTEKIPFLLSFESPAASLAAFLPFGPRIGSTSSNVAMTLDVLRQSTIDVRNELITDAKQDMWRVDNIGQATFNNIENITEKASFSGEITISNTVQVGGFRTAGLSVKDCIVLTMIPPTPGKCPFRDFRLTVPIRLATDPWSADGTGLGHPSRNLSASRDEASEYSVPSSHD